MKKKDYAGIASFILKNVGNLQNITHVTHCITRLRLNIKDRSAVNENELKNNKDILDIQWVNSQLQIVIGTDINYVYQEFCKLTGTKEEVAINENLDELPKKKKTIGYWITQLFDVLSGCVLPTVPVLMGCGFIKIFLTLGVQFNLLDTASQTYIILDFVNNAGIYFLPIFTAYGASKKFNCNTPIALLLCALLLSPTYVAYKTEGIASLSFFGLSMPVVRYSGTVIPAILTVYFLSYVEKFLKKVVPHSLNLVGVSFLSIMIVFPVEFIVLAPLGNYLGEGICTVFMAMYSSVGFLAIAILGALTPFIVMAGMHTVIYINSINLYTSLGYDPTFMITGWINNINQGVACLAVGLKTKNSELRQVAFTNAVTAIVGGVTEPAMYTVNLKYKKPMYAVVIGNFAGCFFAGLMNVGMYAMPGAFSVFSIPCLIAPNSNNLILALIALLISVIVTFICTLLFKLDDQEYSA